jgi:GcrA cell cycle regulator
MSTIDVLGGQTRIRSSSWTDKDIAYLREHAMAMSYSKIAAHLGKTRESVCAKANRLGIAKAGRITSAERRLQARLRTRTSAVPSKNAQTQSRTKPAGQAAIGASTKKTRGAPQPHSAAIFQKAQQVGTPFQPLDAPRSAEHTQSPPASGLAQIDPRDAHLKLKTLDSLLESDCRWPVGDPKLPGFGYCGCAKVSGLPYCEAHALRAYQPPESRRRQAVSRVGHVATITPQGPPASPVSGDLETVA